MATVETIRGPIDTSTLGRVLVHEHVFLMNTEYTYNYRPDFFKDETVAKAAARLQALKTVGYRYDHRPHRAWTGPSCSESGQGSGTDRCQHRSSRPGPIRSTTCRAPFSFYGPGLLCDPPEPMIDHFVRDIVEGMAGTRIKAGELKCAIDVPGLTPGVERVMRAVARTHLITGTPITVHTAPKEETGLIVQRVFAEEGVNLEDVLIGHCGDTTDIDYLMKLADQGSILGMDRFGINFHMTMQERVNTIAEMVKRGYVDHLTLSHDCACWSDFFPTIDEYFKGDAAAQLSAHFPRGDSGAARSGSDHRTD